jgi:hypothetical protein
MAAVTSDVSLLPADARDAPEAPKAPLITSKHDKVRACLHVCMSTYTCV